MTTKTRRGAARGQPVRRRSMLVAGLGAVMSQLSQPAAAQEFPTHPVRLIVPYSVGGPADSLARTLAQKLSQHWPQPVVVENRPGANTIIGMELVARSKPDGHTLILATTAMAINDAIVHSLPYDSSRDFTPVVDLVASSSLLAAHPSLPAHDLRELIALLKASPGKYSCGSGGVGSPTDAAAVLFESMAGVKLVRVPYQGIAPAITDLVAGHIQLVFGDAGVLLPYVKSGKLHAIATTSRSRYAALPEVPTLDEAGVPGYESTLWYGILGPGGMPRDVTNLLNAAFVQAVNDPDTVARLATYGVTVIGDAPEHFATFIESEKAKWKRSAGSMQTLQTPASR
jgi:tripartite-type tricarboxylate transporter receptor subunit TctC